MCALLDLVVRGLTCRECVSRPCGRGPSPRPDGSALANVAWLLDLIKKEKRGFAVTRLARVATVVALVGGVVAGAVPAATAAPAKAKMLESVTLRAKPTNKSTARGIIPKGAVVNTNDTAYVAGATYKACGIKERLWYPVTWKGMKGYVVAACMGFQ
ncbi:hypothetical protein [Streptomyces alanosinicus]|uniref:SH3 domain-containing protein n=1 Tax=Streptomyces alanosinicus TaxID=68171 RepID=A0A919D6S8_9ACTN|nr:hypothetical protein [Streptomyces alanosinicus]GHE11510.1 hypothetical protein GCM10010339_71550 [Streptomyces alanosinicus]